MDSGERLDDEELLVLVTGFGPFRKLFPVNPSGEIALSLPEYLPPPHSKGPRRDAGGAKFPRVRIAQLPEAIRVNYQVVRALVPRIWAGTAAAAAHGTAPPSRPPDLVVHLGMMGSNGYELEQVGHRDSYFQPDVDGELLDDDTRREEEGKKWVWDGVPEKLKTGVDFQDVFERWRDLCPSDTRMWQSTNAGRYLCEFIYFSSLAHLYKRDKAREVIFLHVPPQSDEETLARGREVVLQLIRALVESKLEREGKSPRAKIEEATSLQIELNLRDDERVHVNDKSLEGQ